MNNITHILYVAWSPTNVRFCLYFLCRECWIENMQIFKKERTQMHFMFDDGKCCPICQSKSSRTRSCLLSLHLITMVGEKKKHEDHSNATQLHLCTRRTPWFYSGKRKCHLLSVVININPTNVTYKLLSSDRSVCFFLTVNVEHCDLKP